MMTIHPECGVHGIQTTHQKWKKLKSRLRPSNFCCSIFVFGVFVTGLSICFLLPSKVRAQISHMFTYFSHIFTYAHHIFTIFHIFSPFFTYIPYWYPYLSPPITNPSTAMSSTQEAINSYKARSHWFFEAKRKGRWVLYILYIDVHSIDVESSIIMVNIWLMMVNDD